MPYDVMLNKKIGGKIGGGTVTQEPPKNWSVGAEQLFSFALLVFLVFYFFLFVIFFFITILLLLLLLFPFISIIKQVLSQSTSFLTFSLPILFSHPTGRSE